MSARSVRRAMLFVALFAAACTGGAGEGDGSDAPVPSGDEAEDRVADLSAASVRLYLGQISPMLVGRVLNDSEIASIEDRSAAAIPDVLEGWRTEEGFFEAARTLLEIKLSVSGMRSGIDFGLPGNIVEHVVANNRPWSEILTSETCYDADDTPMECDTGAPFAAGVLATRAYLVSRAGRFNLTRAGTMMNTFACRKYPLEDELQPRLDKTMLIEMFRAESAAEQMDARAAGGFGNGFACYTCHGQFSAHAQPFVRFDRDGMWQEDATGLQNPDAQLGESFDGLSTSHMIDPENAKSEHSQMFGMPVDNLRQAAEVIAANPVFFQCSARNMLEYALDLNDAVGVDDSLVQDVADRAIARNPEPTFHDLLVVTFGHERVILTAVKNLEQEQEEAP